MFFKPPEFKHRLEIGTVPKSNRKIIETEEK
jgi:hypothetical protein